MPGFQDRVVIVTGGSSGIGLSTALRFASGGARIVLADRNEQAGQAAVGQIKAAGAPGAVALACDVGVEEQVESAITRVIDQFGRLDVIVNNAGIMIFKPLVELTRDDWMTVLTVNLLGAFFFLKHGVPRMKSGGAIVNVSSIHAVATTALVAPYAAAKAALLSLTRSAALETKDKGIRVNAVVPGAVDTPMLWDNPNLKSGVEQLDPAEIGKPGDLAAAIAFLASDDAAFITGTALNVDGGRLARL